MDYLAEIDGCSELTDEYEKLTIGDIIWAKRYNNESSMLMIPDGHKEGPFIVIGRYEKRLKCLYGSSVLPNSKMCDYRFLKLDAFEYSLKNVTYFSLFKNCYMARSRVIKKIGHLSMEDEKLLFKKLDIVMNEGMNVEMEIELPVIPLEIGDIIKKNNGYYLIIDVTDDNYFCLKILNENKDSLSFPIIIDQTKYYLNFSSVKKISKECWLVRKNFIDDMTLKKVLAVFKQKLNDLNLRYEVSRGSLVRINGVNYYVYGEIGNEWMAFPILGQIQKNLCLIVIGGKQFYTDFKDCIRFPKRDIVLEVLANASDKEKDEIKKLKKSYQKSKVYEGNSVSQILKKNDIGSGSIIRCTKNNVTDLHIVILRNEQELVTIKYDNYLNGEYILSKFYVSDVEKIGFIEDLNLKQILFDILNICDGYINKKRLKRMIDSF